MTEGERRTPEAEHIEDCRVRELGSGLSGLSVAVRLCKPAVSSAEASSWGSRPIKKLPSRRIVLVQREYRIGKDWPTLGPHHPLRPKSPKTDEGHNLSCK